MPPKVDKESWTEQHTTILLRGAIHQLLISRPALSSLTGLEGVSENGGTRINEHLKQLLRKLAAGTGTGNEGMVVEEIQHLKEAKSRGNGKGTPGNSKGSRGSPKKRKVKDEEDEQ